MWEVNQMSSGKALDREDTFYEAKARERLLANRNWLRHGKNTSAGRIDEMLFDWVTMKQLSSGSNSPVTRVRAHLYHLIKEHKLLIDVKGDKFRYDLEGLRRMAKRGK